MIIDKLRKDLRLLVLLCLVVLSPFILAISIPFLGMFYNYYCSDLAVFSYKISIGEPFETVEPKVLKYYEKNKHRTHEEFLFRYYANASEGLPSRSWKEGKHFYLAEEAPFPDNRPMELDIFFDSNDRVEDMFFSAD